MTDWTKGVSITVTVELKDFVCIGAIGYAIQLIDFKRHLSYSEDVDYHMK